MFEKQAYYSAVTSPVPFLAPPPPPLSAQRQAGGCHAEASTRCSTGGGVNEGCADTQLAIALCHKHSSALVSHFNGNFRNDQH